MNQWDDAERRVEKAQELFEQRRWAEALEELRAATSINPYNGGWFFNIGLTLDELERYEEAIDAYRRAIDIDANDLQAMQHLGIDLHRVGKLKEALEIFTRMEGIDSTFEPSYCHRIITYSDLGHHEKAEEMFYLARLYKEHCPHCYYNMGCSLRARGMFDKAIYCWQKVVDLDDNYPQVQVRIAEAYWGKGELELARQHYLTGLRQDPGNTDTLLDLGDLLLEMGRSDEAGEKYRQAIELAPEEPGGYFCHGQWLASLDRDGEAAEAFAKVLQLDPTYPAAHLRLGELYFRQRDILRARKHLRAEVLLRPSEARVMADLATLLAETGQNRAAVACLKRLVQAEPKNVNALQNLAVAQFMVGRFEEGIETCRAALEVSADNVVIIYNLALALDRLGRRREALRWVRKGLAIDANDISLQRLRVWVHLHRLRDKTTKAIRCIIPWSLFGKNGAHSS
jgi:tetratricopeptide (TPR) repeat protein